jgi:CTP:molybdopterin cytidylyltransferase MocA
VSPVRIAVVLAAGAGSRFHGPGHKLSSALEPASGEAAGGTVIGRALAAVLQSGIGPVVVVTGAAPDVVPGDLVDQVTICHNPTWAEGQMTSLLVGLRHAAELGCIEAVIGLADQPFVTPDAWRTVAAAAGPIAVATYDGRRGTPVKLDRSVWHLLPAGGDEGARALMRVRPDLVREVACTGSPADIDTEEDLRRWQSN